MFSILSFPTFPSLVEIDESQTIPGEPDFWLVTDERFQSLAELRAYVETVYTPAYVDKYLSSYFEDKDVKEGPSYKEYEGRFYANSNLAGIGNIAITMWDTLRILSQDEKQLNRRSGFKYWWYVYANRKPIPWKKAEKYGGWMIKVQVS